MANYSTYGGVNKIAGMLSESIKVLGGDPERAHRVDIRHSEPKSDRLVTRNIILISVEVEPVASAIPSQRADDAEGGSAGTEGSAAANGCDAQTPIPSSRERK